MKFLGGVDAHHMLCIWWQHWDKSWSLSLSFLPEQLYKQASNLGPGSWLTLVARLPFSSLHPLLLVVCFLSWCKSWLQCSLIYWGVFSCSPACFGIGSSELAVLNLIPTWLPSVAVLFSFFKDNRLTHTTVCFEVSSPEKGSTKDFVQLSRGYQYL